jgi:hypothetical protein
MACNKRREMLRQAKNTSTGISDLFVLNAYTRWAVGVTAARRTTDLLSSTLGSLINAGWENPIVFYDGSPDIALNVELVSRTKSIGAFPNFYSAASELLMRFPHAQAYLLAQDDILLAKNTRFFLEECSVPEDACVLKLFTHDACQAENYSWSRLRTRNDMKGAQAYVFSHKSLIQFLTSDEPINHRSGDYRPDNAIDNVVAYWARDLERSQRKYQYVYTPSLVQHTGTNHSTLGHDMPTASSFVGEEFDAMRLLCRGLHVTCVMITGHNANRRKLARMSIKSFREQTYQDKDLLIITTGATSLFNSDFPRLENEQEVFSDDLTLGELRNIGIEQSIGPLVCQWDDDDWSHPDRVKHQVSQYQTGYCVTLAHQVRLNINSDEFFVMSRGVGIEGTILHEKNISYRYPADRRGEDTVFYHSWDKKRRKIFDNPPELYVRLYHGDNTWDEQHVMKTDKSYTPLLSIANQIISHISQTIRGQIQDD